MAKGSQPKTSRNLKIVEYKDKKGMSLGKIAKVFNLSQPRTWEIYTREKKREMERA